MLRSFRIVSVLISVLLLSGCAGGTIGGLLPAPKMMAGNVEGDYYTSKNGEFTVQLPYPPSKSDSDSYEWRYAQVREIEDGPVVGIVFGPAAFDKSLYHTVLIKSPMQGNKEEYAKDIFSKKAGSRNGTYSLRGEGTFQEGNKKGFYSVYESESSMLLLTLIDNENSFYAVEADFIKGGSMSPEIDSLLNIKWGVVGDLISSFEINKI